MFVTGQQTGQKLRHGSSNNLPPTKLRRQGRAQNVGLHATSDGYGDFGIATVIGADAVWAKLLEATEHPPCSNPPCTEVSCVEETGYGLKAAAQVVVCARDRYLISSVNL